MRFPRNLLLLPVAFGLMMAVGCGSKTSPTPVSGVLIWEDGKPISGATITFMPVDENSRAASGFTGADGKFELTTYRQGDGAIPGDYKVIVKKEDAGSASSPPPTAPKEMSPEEATKMMRQYNEAQAKKKKSEIPGIYEGVKTTPLQWKVEAGAGEAKIKLKKL